MRSAAAGCAAPLSSTGVGRRAKVLSLPQRPAGLCARAVFARHRVQLQTHSVRPGRTEKPQAWPRVRLAAGVPPHRTYLSRVSFASAVPSALVPLCLPLGLLHLWGTVHARGWPRGPWLLLGLGSLHLGARAHGSGCRPPPLPPLVRSACRLGCCTFGAQFMRVRGCSVQGTAPSS